MLRPNMLQQFTSIATLFFHEQGNFFFLYSYKIAEENQYIEMQCTMFKINSTSGVLILQWYSEVPRIEFLLRGENISFFSYKKDWEKGRGTLWHGMSLKPEHLDVTRTLQDTYCSIFQYFLLRKWGHLEDNLQWCTQEAHLLSLSFPLVSWRQ